MLSSMRALCSLIAAGLTFTAAAEDSWVRNPPPRTATDPSWDALPESYYYQVAVSKWQMAESRLTDGPIVPLHWNAETAFGQRQFACPNGTLPFLVRAVYDNGGTGNFAVLTREKQLLIVHGSLGPPTAQHRSALVVCLNVEPESVFVASPSGAI